MQGGLVDDRSDQQGRAIFLEVYGQAPKPVRPAVGEVTFYSKTIDVAHVTAPRSVINIGTIYMRGLPVESTKGCSRGCNWGV